MSIDPHPPELTIVLPAYREAETLRHLLPAWKTAAAALTPAYEILIIDTETSLDDTAEICADAGVRHVHRTGGNQFGDAMRTAQREARGQFILCMDADGSHDPKHMASMWAERARYDIVIGSRYAKGGHTENPAILIAMSYLVNLTFRIVFHLQCKDVTNSFRIYRGDLLRGLRLQSNDFDILEEILIKAVAGRDQATVGEVPVVFGRRKAGESKRKLLPFAMSYLHTLFVLRRFEKIAKEEARTR